MSLPLLAAGLSVVPAQAQYGQPQVRADLQDALRRIAANANDSSALADAGLAALKLEDTRAAIGFLAKADEIYSRSGRVKAGLARALLLERNPFGALRYFEEAITHGIAAKDIAADRGLAFDLIGRTADAQKDYALAFQYDRSDSLLIRYAISLGISGDVEGAEAKLAPLLQKSDRDAWRSRAFILAMNGKDKEANKIARQTMEKRMAKAIEPFFDNMPELTAAQKAAAVHFGHFPASANIGVDVATVRFASQNATRSGGADANLIPAGEPLGQQSAKIRAMPDKSPRRRPGSKAKKEKRVVVSTRVPNGKMDQSFNAPSTLNLPTRILPEPENVHPLVKPVDAGRTFDRGEGAGQTKAAITRSEDNAAETLVSQSIKRKTAGGNVPAPSAKSNEEPSTRQSLSDIIGSITVPENSQKSDIVPVDLASITPARAQPKVQPAAKKPEAKPEPPKYPKRYWVQIATGSDLNALKFDYRRMVKKSPDLFAGLDSWTSPWGQTRRMVVGPFDDIGAAKEFESKFRKAGGDGFAWISNDGTIVNKLD
ncbi:SPOR domain-containing protein [Parasphingorhabdus sp. JC815]|uniref:SPOR domain-containing protein n=1 Tax=Parasphingorhabdus sp. JC815 TaxID=3232140 RepID=UPI00345919EA